MSNTTLTTAPTPEAVVGHLDPAPYPTRRGPVLLATSGAPHSKAPAIIARAIAARLQRPLRVISAVEPTFEYGGAFAPVPVMSPIEPELREAREAAVRRYLAETLDADTPFTLEVRTGHPTFEVANASRECDASLVVVGAAPRETRRGIVAGTRASAVLRNVVCPVLSVAPSRPGLPMQGVVAIDFSPASLRAARDAMLVIGDGGTLTLLHVALPIHVNRPTHLATDAVYPRDALERLLALRDDVAAMAPEGVTIVTRMAAGDATDEILAAVETLAADLLVVGTHGPGVLERTFLGSVASDLMRLAPCSVLASPRPAAALQLEFEADQWGTGVTNDATAWPEVLDAFTRRNAGRPVRVEVDDPEFGAQVQARGFALLGATFDAHDKRVELMLSNGEGASRLTRGIAMVERLAIARGPDGRDTALQLRHGDGETLVIFLDA